MILHPRKKRTSYLFPRPHWTRAKKYWHHFIVTEQRMLKHPLVLEWQEENHIAIYSLTMATVELATTPTGHFKLTTTWVGATVGSKICLTYEWQCLDNPIPTEKVTIERLGTSSSSSEKSEPVHGGNPTIVPDKYIGPGRFSLKEPQFQVFPRDLVEGATYTYMGEKHLSGQEIERLIAEIYDPKTTPERRAELDQTIRIGIGLEDDGFH